MQNKEQSLLLIHRENYNVPKGQERSVHCKIAKLDANGNFLEKARLVRFGVKAFETAHKDNLETMGYTVEILYHPMGRYNNSIIRDKDVEIAEKNREIEALKEQVASESMAEKDAEIARLKAELAEAREKAEKVDVAKTNVDEAPTEVKKNKGGRPRKES